MQASDAGKGPRYTSTVAAFSSIYRSEGLAGLYRGVGPTTQRAAILTASQLASYDQAKHWIIQHGWLNEGIYAHLAASMIAGCLYINIRFCVCVYYVSY